MKKYNQKANLTEEEKQQILNEFIMKEYLKTKNEKQKKEEKKQKRKEKTAIKNEGKPSLYEKAPSLTKEEMKERMAKIRAMRKPKNIVV